MIKRTRIYVKGRVQGVGFRPTVYRYAAALELSGFVRNTTAGVLIEAQGDDASIAEFIARLKLRPPAQARIEKLVVEECHLAPEPKVARFNILPSGRSGELSAGMPPDLATCDECRAELFDPADRRHRYPFINCTNCGPRFSIIRSLPYDRNETSMAVFEFCDNCRAEYLDPPNRRFDAQPNACPECGPSVKLLTSKPEQAPGDPFRAAAELLKKGAILAVKGIGGYHLCCDAACDRAVALLRKRKNRPHKSLAVMFPSLNELRKHAEVSEAEAGELSSCAAPIVIVRRRPNAQPSLSRLLSPDTDDIGAFLPYSPLHHLLLSETGPLVMTSGNLAEEPIAKDEEELDRLMGRVSDAALVHDRGIVRRCDDSVLKMVKGRRLILRRSRGIVPDPIRLPFDGPQVLACGAEWKNTICITRGNRAFVSPHVGDLADPRSYEFFIETIRDFSELLRARPEVVAHDAHPDYPSTRYAFGLAVPDRVAVQHHHAHVAACMAEHGIDRRVIGVALDGTGFGPDGTIWGGEFLAADYRSWRRVAHFKQYRMPGGEQAILNPARMALSCLLSDLPSPNHSLMRELLPVLTDEEWAVLPDMIESGFRSPLTSSAGRMFDAAAALLGMPEPVTYEGQAAVRLQALARRDTASTYPFKIERGKSPAVISFEQMFIAMISDITAGTDRALIAGKFHNTIAHAVAGACSIIRENEGLDHVALSGGVFQNEYLLELVGELLTGDRFHVYTHHAVPPNDGGISLGQAAVAMAQRKC